MSLLYYMSQSILITFASGYFFGAKESIIFTDGGYPLPTPFAENSTKIINLIFETFPKAFLFLIPALVRFLDMPKAKSIIHQIWLREAMGAILKKKSQKEEKVKRGGGSARKSANNSKCVIC